MIPRAGFARCGLYNAWYLLVDSASECQYFSVFGWRTWSAIILLSLLSTCRLINSFRCLAKLRALMIWNSVASLFWPCFMGLAYSSSKCVSMPRLPGTAHDSVQCSSCSREHSSQKAEKHTPGAVQLLPERALASKGKDSVQCKVQLLPERMLAPKGRETRPCCWSRKLRHCLDFILG
jgi:hypothetical protein